MARGLLAAALLLGGCRLKFDDVVDSGGSNLDALRTYREAVLLDGAIGYWRLGDLNGAARDEKGNVDGTFSGACQLGLPGVIAQDPDHSVGFGGSTCEVGLGSNYVFAGNAPFSIELWVNSTNAPTYEHYFTMETRAGGVPTDGYAVFSDNGSVGVSFERVIGSSGLKTPGTPFGAGVWVYLVGVYDGITMSLYLDGALVKAVTDTRPMPVHAGTTMIGAYPMGAHATGQIDDVAVYGVALSAAQVQRHHTLGVIGPQ